MTCEFVYSVHFTMAEAFCKRFKQICVIFTLNSFLVRRLIHQIYYIYLP